MSQSIEFIIKYVIITECGVGWPKFTTSGICSPAAPSYPSIIKIHIEARIRLLGCLSRPHLTQGALLALAVHAGL